jgi:phosphoribosylaminoimidazole-succinocarboxamide synthase/phosphoribosylcarboxyaminoimidazole (NCAIR) mutase
MKFLYNGFFLISIIATSHSFASIIAEGKTKIVRSYDDDRSLAIFEAKDDITAGDGAKHDVIEGKNELATQTACNVFRLLNDCGIPVAFVQQLDSHSFLGDLCEMIQYEVVVRREAHGSYLKRHPYLEKGHVFPKLIVEFFLKTNNRNWMGASIPKDDPYIQFTTAGAELFLPDAPIDGQRPFMTLSDFPLKDQPALFEQIATIAKQAFLILEKAWQLENGRLVDFKVEFGINSSGKLLLADVIDNDSWRVIQNQQYIDKQIYRDGGAIDKVAALYRHVSMVTGNFKLPEQQLILWRGSEYDDFEPFMKQLTPFSNDHLKIAQVTCSIHKNPVGGYLMLQDQVKQTPDSVLIAYIGRSNGAGPSLAANATIPVITTPAGWDRCHEDVWSSLRAPSLTPVMTVLEPQNAILAALQILAVRNPLLYMQLRLKQEERLMNVLGLDE